MSDFTQNIINCLQKSFFIGFEIIDFVNDDRFSIGFAKQDSHLIKMDVFIRSDSRLKISLKMGLFAAELVKSMSEASIERKTLFWDNMKMLASKPCCKINLQINGIDATKEIFLSNGWRNFELHFESFPFYDIEDDNRFEIISSHCCDIWRMALCLIPYTVEGEAEGTEYEKTITTHERNPINRQLCVQFKGFNCAVCGMSFEEKYGKIGKGFIEVHHTNPVANMGDNHVVDIINELVPLCSNCHSMIHRRKPPYTVKELQDMLINTDETVTMYELPTEHDAYDKAADYYESLPWNEIEQVISNIFGKDKTVLLGCYKNTNYNNWILSKNTYTVRLGKRKGSTEDYLEYINNASVLILYDFNDVNKYYIFDITEHKVMSGLELKAMDYPNKKPAKEYMTFAIEPQLIPYTLTGITDIVQRIIDRYPNHVKGAPIFLIP